MAENIYAIQCENNKWYIGKSSNCSRRFNEHMSGNGSFWTKKYKPINIIVLKESTGMFDEDNTVLEYMINYGIDNVRGGSFTTMELSDSQREQLTKQIATATNACFYCQSKKHFASECEDAPRIKMGLDKIDYQILIDYIKNSKPSCIFKRVGDKMMIGDNYRLVDINEYHVTKIIIKMMKETKNGFVFDKSRNFNDKDLCLARMYYQLNNIHLNQTTNEERNHVKNTNTSSQTCTQTSPNIPSIQTQTNPRIHPKPRVDNFTACYRCGREGHWINSCYAKTTVDGEYIQESDDEESEYFEDSESDY